MLKKPMIKFDHVTKQFGSLVALKDINVEIEPGEFVFLTGRSGAGKTTLIRLLLREMSPSEGEVSIDGRDIRTLKSSEIPYYRRKIGVVFQDFKLLQERTVYENVRLAAEIDGKVTSEEEERITDVIAKVGMTERSNLFPRQLSGGEVQRAVIARVLLMKPKIILADEPTGNLDPETARQIVELLNLAAKEGTTVLMATHNADIVNELKHRVINLKDGKVETDLKKGKYEKTEKAKVEKTS